MVRFLKTSVWLVVACAALVAQVVPQAWGGDCDRRCCAADGCGADIRECCTACPAETARPPCRCRLDARDNQPLSVDRVTPSPHEELGRGVFAYATALEAPAAVGVSREYVAASLAVPIRPTRILYGVWRN
jgi:hypothetical protein